MHDRTQGVTYFEWKSQYFKSGHVSLRLNDGTYISFWQMSPCWRILSSIGFSSVKTNIFLVLIDYVLSIILLSVRNAVQTKSYEQDVKILGREADKRITFHGSFLDEDIIKCWWNQIANVASYGLLTRNCSTVVFKALHTGGATRFLDDPRYIIWTPNRLYKYCELLQWNTYRLRIYTNKNNEKVGTDFEYIFQELRNYAEIETGRKQQFDKKRQDMAKMEDDIEKDSKKRKTEDEQSSDEDDKEERENRYTDELKSDESETDEKQLPNGEHYSVDLEGGEVSMDGQGVLVKKMPRKRNRKRRKKTTKYLFNIMQLRVKKDRTFGINNAILNNFTVIAFQCRSFC